MLVCLFVSFYVGFDGLGSQTVVCSVGRGLMFLFVARWFACCCSLFERRPIALVACRLYVFLRLLACLLGLLVCDVLFGLQDVCWVCCLFGLLGWLLVG